MQPQDLFSYSAWHKQRSRARKLQVSFLKLSETLGDTQREMEELRSQSMIAGAQGAAAAANFNILTPPHHTNNFKPPQESSPKRPKRKVASDSHAIEMQEMGNGVVVGQQQGGDEEQAS